MQEMLFSKTHTQLAPQKLIEIALMRKEGILCSNQALAVTTGKRTGRSPKDRFIVKDALTANTVNWGTINQPFSEERFNLLWSKAYTYLSSREVFISHLNVGADSHYTLPVTVVTELAWHNLFAMQLFIRDQHQPSETNIEKGWTILSAPGFKTDPLLDGSNSDGILILNFTQRRVLLCGIQYAGEIKKAMFSVLNFLLPAQDVLPMHCSANLGKKGDVALFFGLSGTGKTTLSADPERYLIGDDEHGWSQNGIFNFEGGCYAKCINLSEKNEPMIWKAISYGAIMENVVLDAESGDPHYEDSSLTENTRAAYPREHILQRLEENQAGHPQSVIFLTCDLYGVFPPVSLLTLEQAAYYFLSGYTALVGSTEVGSTAEIKPTFSTCFGAPFFPRPAKVYADLLMKRIKETNATVHLVNTGWTGGAYGKGGKRFDIPTTRQIIHSILSGDLLTSPKIKLPGFDFAIPERMEGIDSNLLDPRRSWSDAKAYEEQANLLMSQFIENFKKFDVPENIRAAGPSLA